MGFLLTLLLLTLSDSVLLQTETEKGERFVGAYYYVWYEEGVERK